MATAIPVEDLDDSVRRRFWSHVDRSGECWEWTGSTAAGYGRFRVSGRLFGAHRISVAIRDGEDIPQGLCVDHLCRNRRCVRPEHLECVTLTENTARGSSVTADALRAVNESGHCANGHPRVEGSRRMVGGRLRCILCERERSRRRDATPEAKRKRNARMRRLRAKRAE